MSLSGDSYHSDWKCSNVACSSMSWERRFERIMVARETAFRNIHQLLEYEMSLSGDSCRSGLRW